MTTLGDKLECLILTGYKYPEDYYRDLELYLKYDELLRNIFEVNDIYNMTKDKYIRNFKVISLLLTLPREYILSNIIEEIKVKHSERYNYN